MRTNLESSKACVFTTVVLNMLVATLPPPDIRYLEYCILK